MLHRVLRHSNKPRFALPRKGRIRLILLGVILTTTLFFTVGKKPPSPSPGAPQEIDSGMTRPTVEKTEKMVNNRPRGKVAAPVRTYRFEDLSALLKKYPPNVGRVRDTLHFTQHSIVLHYSIDTTILRYGRRLLHRYHPKYGAVAFVESSTGRVLGLINYSHEKEPFLGHDLYVRSYFPAASVFKTVTATGVLEKGGFTVQSKCRTVGKNHTLYTYQLEKELDHYRTVSLADAFAYSINPVFGRLGVHVLGKQGLVQAADRYGFFDTIPFELSSDPQSLKLLDSTFALAEVASGFNQETRISPLFGALMAAGVSQKGSIPRPTLVDSVTDLKTGRVAGFEALMRWEHPQRGMISPADFIPDPDLIAQPHGELQPDREIDLVLLDSATGTKHKGGMAYPIGGNLRNKTGATGSEVNRLGCLRQ